MWWVYAQDTFNVSVLSKRLLVLLRSFMVLLGIGLIQILFSYCLAYRMLQMCLNK